MSSVSMGEVIGRLQQEGLLEQGQASLAPAELGNAALATPWYLRFMVGFGAWLAAVFFMGFFTLLTHSKPAALFFGALLLIAAIATRRLDRGDFLNQLAFAASLSGQLLILFGSDIRSATGMALLVLALQGVTIAFYRDKTHRLLSTLVAIAALQALFFEWKWPYAAPALAGLLAMAFTHFWLQGAAYSTPTRDRLLRPIAYGLVIAMFGLLLPSMFPPAFNNDNPFYQHARHLWLSTVLLGAVLLYLVHVFLKERGLRPFGPLAWAGYDAVLLLMWPGLKAPGLIGALIVLLIGFRRGNRLLIGMALLFLAAFLSAYYYHLSISLLQKSAALAGSGAVLLALRWALLKLLPREEKNHAH